MVFGGKRGRTATKKVAEGGLMLFDFFSIFFRLEREKLRKILFETLILGVFGRETGNQDLQKSGGGVVLQCLFDFFNFLLAGQNFSNRQHRPYLTAN